MEPSRDTPGVADEIGSAPHRGAPLPPNEDERLELLREYGILDSQAEADFDDLTRLAALICGVPIALVSLVDEKRQWFKSRVGLDVTETPRELAFCAYAILQPGQVMEVQDASKDPRFASNALVTSDPNIRFYAGAPLVADEGLPLGTLCVIGTEPRQLTAAQMEALAVLSRQVVTQIQLRRQNLALLEAKFEREQFFTLPLDMLCIADADGRFKVLNHAFSEALGYTIEELTAVPFMAFVHPDDIAATEAQLVRLRSGKPALNFENRYRCRNGGYRWLNWRCAPARGGLFYASARDVTERREAEAALEANRSLICQFVKHAPAAIAMLDREMRYLQVSDRWLVDYQLGDTDLIGKSHYEVFPDIPDRWKEVHQRVMGGAVERCDEEIFQRADGTVEWLQWEVRPWYSGVTEIGGVILVTQIITARKMADASLQESEKRFREAIEYSAIGMALVGLDGSCMKANRALCATLGRSEEELRQCTFQEITHPDDVEADLARVHELVAGRIDHYQIEKRYLHKDGHPVQTLLAVTLVRDSAGQPAYFVKQIEDITARHEAERRLKASLAEKDTLLQEIHHRVKNNLQLVSSLLSLQSGYIQDVQMLAQFSECQRRIRAMALIHEKLYHSESLACVDLRDYLQSLIRIIFDAYAAQGNIRLETAIEAVTTDLDTAVPLGLLVNELLTNALKYAFPENRAGSVRVALRSEPDGYCTLLVEDDGVGLPPDFQLGTAKTLGMRLVAMFAKQLRAEMTLERLSTRTSIAIRCRATQDASAPSSPSAP